MRVNTVFSSEQGYQEHNAVEPTVERDLISIDKPLKLRCVVAVGLRCLKADLLPIFHHRLVLTTHTPRRQLVNTQAGWIISKVLCIGSMDSYSSEICIQNKLGSELETGKSHSRCFVHSFVHQLVLITRGESN